MGTLWDVSAHDLLYWYDREQLKRHYNLCQYKLSVSMEDLASFDAQLADRLTRLPAEYLPLVRTNPLCVPLMLVCVCVIMLVLRAL